MAGWRSASLAYRRCAAAVMFVKQNNKGNILATKVAVIINAGAGCGYASDWAQQLEATFAGVGLDAAITLAGSGEEMIATAQQAIKDGAPIVVAGGGDGTINAVASVVVGSGTPFGVLPPFLPGCAGLW